LRGVFASNLIMTKGAGEAVAEHKTNKTGDKINLVGFDSDDQLAFRAATRADPMFAEAWYNLSDLLDEQGRSEAAIDCLRRALHAAPEYVDAMFNLALLLQRSNRHNEAAEYWRRYLVNDGQSEWAARARRSLKF